MQKLLFILTSTFVLWGCNQPSSDPNADKQDTTKHETAGSENSLMGLGGDLKMDAVVLGTGVRSRKSPDVKGEIVRPFEQGELVKVIEISQKRDALSSEKPCDGLGYDWVKVKDGKGDESWIFGQYLYKFSQLKSEKGRVHGGQEILAGGTKYHFHLAADLGVGPGSDGDTRGCDLTVAPLLVQEGASKAILFYADPKKIPMKHLVENANLFDAHIFLLNAESMEIYDRIEELTVDAKEPVITMTLSHSHFFEKMNESSTLKARISKERVDVVEFESTGAL